MPYYAPWKCVHQHGGVSGNGGKVTIWDCHVDNWNTIVVFY